MQPTQSEEASWLIGELDRTYWSLANNLSWDDARAGEFNIEWMGVEAVTLEIELDHDRPERDADAAAASGLFGLVVQNTEAGYWITGLVCQNASQLGDGWRRSSWSTSDVEITDDPADRQGRRNRSYEVYATRYNLALLAHPEHPLTGRCHPTEPGKQPSLVTFNE
tara:strand:+ start:197 stop:694 length:498 start_codon:yes stop_codon:yes gene_type:complete